MKLKALGLYKWILLKWKFPPIPEMSLAVRPGLVGLQQLGMWTGTKAKLSKLLRPTHPSPCYAYSSPSTPLPCLGPLDPQESSESSHLCVPFSLSPSTTLCPLHPCTPDTPSSSHCVFTPHTPHAFPPSTSHTHTHLTLFPPPTLSSYCPFTPHLLSLLYLDSYHSPYTLSHT